ncbi:hypothetical protein AB0M92_19005 [Streptomyces sp. NPDC051582]|uniref:hypothetical protein n=1 Tax=Streptomyces sp. NPDC051582 TaxID=3155167 RepID=UPI0034229D40
MGRTWNANRRRDESDFLNWLRKGKTVYVITDHRREPDAALMEHPRTYNSYTCTGEHPLIGGWQMSAHFVNGKAISHTDAATLFRWAGEVHDTPPHGIPHASDPGPRVNGPLPYGTYEMSPKEIQYQHDQAEDRANGDLKAGRRKRTSWF